MLPASASFPPLAEELADEPAPGASACRWCQRFGRVVLGWGAHTYLGVQQEGQTFEERSVGLVFEEQGNA